MNKEIPFSGLASSPDDYQSPDGQLSSSFNLIHDDGSLLPVPQPHLVLDISTISPDPPLVILPDRRGYRPTLELVYIHDTPLFRHFIVVQHNHDSDNIHWLDADADHDSYSISADNRLAESVRALKISSVGNTLTVALASGITYFKWDQDNGRYKNLGQRPPMVQLRFNLSENKKAPFDNSGLNIHSGSLPNDSFTAWIDTGIKFDSDLFVKHEPGATQLRKISFKHNKISSITQAVWALVNKSNNVVSEQGHFFAPFFVRYAYRLYDGSLWMHSAPVFMPVSSPSAFNVAFANAACYNHHAEGYKFDYVDPIFLARFIGYVQDDNHYMFIFGDDGISIDPGDKVLLNYTPRNVALSYYILNQGDYEQLSSDWDDIVKSVDIFVSQPLIRERSDKNISSVSVSHKRGFRLNNGNITSIKDLNLISAISYDDFNISHDDNLDISEEDDLSNSWFVQDTHEGELVPEGNTRVALCNVNVDIPLISTDDYLRRIQSVASFYKIASFNIPDLEANNNSDIAIESTILPNLTTQEAMSDDYHSHNPLLPAFDNNGQCLTSLFAYNNRQVIAGLAERLYEGFPLSSLLPRQSAFQYVADYFRVSHVFVYLDTEQGRRIVDCTGDGNLAIGKHALFCCPLFYPDNRAVQMDVAVILNGVQKLLRFPMHQHPFLNGSITDGHILVDSTPPAFDIHDYEQPQLSDTLTLINYIYNSEVNNPFVFLPANITRIPTQRILAVSTAAKALSQGQFGQFPLYAFCSDGVWAIEVASDGSFSARQPITRDILSNPDSITQLDSSVLFATNRGIMMLSGSNASCISDIISNDNSLSLLALPKLAALDSSLPDTAPFLSFINDCRFIYDYTNQRIFIFNALRDDNPSFDLKYPPSLPGETPLPYTDITHRFSPRYPYAYVYSLKSKQWGMTSSNLASVLNDYPSHLALTHDNHLVSFSSSDSTLLPVPGLLISRPIKLGIPYALKTVNNLVVRGCFQHGNVKTILYGSRDLIHWHIVASSSSHAIRSIHGSPYKYFRIVVLSSLSLGQSIDSVSVVFEPRHSNRPL